MSSFNHAPILSIFHPGALGDGLLALDSLRELRTQFPEHSIFWFGHKGLGDVLVAAQEVHQSYSFDNLNFLGNAGGHSPHLKLFSSLFNRCDRAVGWMNDPEGIWQRFFTTVGIKSFILRSPHDPGLRQYHMADRYVETLLPWLPTQQIDNQLPLKFKGKSFPLFAPSEVVEEGNSCKKPLIILHPGSGSTYKCAPAILWANMVNALMSRPHREIVMVGGPADTDILQQVQNLLTDVPPTFLTGLDLLSIGRYLQYARLFVGLDSGLSHLATRLGIPSVLLFGPTDPAKWAPRGEHIVVVRNSCHCVGKEAIEQCKKCFSIPMSEAVTKSEELLCRMRTFIARAPLEFLDDSAQIPCLD
jgi:heptosyltransferase III